MVIRSDCDYSKLEGNEGTPLFKIHGCITQDTVDGHRGRLTLTEDDYAAYAQYRKILFARLGFDLATKDVLIIGQSLKDHHVQHQMRETAATKAEASGAGRLLALLYETDNDRAALWEARGFTVAFGDIDTFLGGLTVAQPPESTEPGDATSRLLLKPLLRTAAIDVDHGLKLPPDPVRMFNGRAATYADIAAGHTFARSALAQMRSALATPRVQFLSIVGYAGVGKTTLARALLAQEAQEGTYCWEHPFDFPLLQREWLEVDDQLQERGQNGILLIDGCTPFLRQVNRLAAKLAAKDEARLKLVLTATAAQWRPRLKEPVLWKRGKVFELSRLTQEDIRSLVRLAAENPAIRSLVEPGFAALPADKKMRRLTERARADMYVCLKNVFANEQLDNILLREFAELDEPQQDVYRFVAALQALGGHVHRQLVLRLLDVSATDIKGLLQSLEGVVDEYVISADEGLYGWSTRHEVIARTIAEYKYSGQEELRELLHRVVDELNPTVYVEVRTLREMCNSDWGVAKLPNDEDQLEIFQKMVAIAPSERIPRHRVIRKLLDMERLEAAVSAIRDAEEAVGLDRPINRFKVRLAILRAQKTQGILPQDRLAMLRSAEGVALKGIDRFGEDRRSYSAYADVGLVVARLSGDLSVLNAALKLMNAAYENILDPVMGEDIERFERLRADMAR